jgi:hypothetical protein
MSSGSMKRNPDKHFLFLSNVPVNHLQFPQQTPIERAACLQDLFYIFLKFLIKISLNKKISLLSKTLGKERPSMFHKSEVPMERDAHF